LPSYTTVSVSKSMQKNFVKITSYPGRQNNGRRKKIEKKNPKMQRVANPDGYFGKLCSIQSPY
jgi:hypothetical protein